MNPALRVVLTEPFKGREIWRGALADFLGKVVDVDQPQTPAELYATLTAGRTASVNWWLAGTVTRCWLAAVGPPASASATTIEAPKPEAGLPPPAPMPAIDPPVPPPLSLREACAEALRFLTDNDVPGDRPMRNTVIDRLQRALDGSSWRVITPTDPPALEDVQLLLRSSCPGEAAIETHIGHRSHQAPESWRYIYDCEAMGALPIAWLPLEATPTTLPPHLVPADTCPGCGEQRCQCPEAA